MNPITHNIRSNRKRYTPRYLRGRTSKFYSFFFSFDSWKNRVYSIEDNDQKVDYDAISSDWKMVGEDLRSATEELKKELSK